MTIENRGIIITLNAEEKNVLSKAFQILDEIACQFEDFDELISDSGEVFTYDEITNTMGNIESLALSTHLNSYQPNYEVD